VVFSDKEGEMFSERKRRLFLGLGLLLVGVVFAAQSVGSALAATTVGQTGGSTACAGGSVHADRTYAVPSGGGTITSFSFQSDSSNAGHQVDFLVLRPGSSDYRVVGKTGLVSLAGTGLESFPANISVQAGDILGLWIGDLFTNCLRSGPISSGYFRSNLTLTDPNVGDTVVNSGIGGNFDLNESATLVTAPTNKDQCKNNGRKNFPSSRTRASASHRW
jgi:hypothetical protein